MLSQRLDASLQTIASLAAKMEDVERIAEVLIEQLSSGGTIWTAGNGGSAAQALHFSEELVGRYRDDRPPLPSVMLAADAALLTCTANDFGFEEVFARPVRALASKGDVLLVLSTSGRSNNLVRALQAAKDCGCVTIGLLGADGGDCREHCDHALIVDAADSAFIQDAHQVTIHLLCEAIEHWALSPDCSGTAS
jgi:D-sedoheptulose 7-phosphate isomerase